MTSNLRALQRTNTDATLSVLSSASEVISAMKTPSLKLISERMAGMARLEQVSKKASRSLKRKQGRARTINLRCRFRLSECSFLEVLLKKQSSVSTASINAKSEREKCL